MGWSEIILVAVAALIVVGPKDLPVLFQSLGKMTAKVRRMAREFSSAMSDAADSTGMKDVAKDMKNMTSPSNLGMDTLRDAADKFDKWQPPKSKARGPETAKMTEERKADAEKIRQKSADMAQARIDREKAAEVKEAAEAKEPKKAKKTKKTAKAKAAAEASKAQADKGEVAASELLDEAPKPSGDAA